MNKRRLTILLITALLVVTASYLFNRLDLFAAQPAIDTENISIEVEASTPLIGQKTSDERIDFWQTKVQRDDKDYISLTYLGEAYMQKARETGDAAVYQRAETALRQAQEINPNYELTLAYLSAALISQHDFAGALELAERVYSFDPQALQALATIGDANLELGRYERAATAYETLLVAAPSPPVYGRLARLSWLQGQPDTAIDRMQQALDEATAAGQTGERLAWYQFQLGELYFNTGQLEQAEAHYQAAQNTFADYYLGLAGLGKVAAARGDWETAIRHYETLVKRLPQPGFVAALGDYYALSGDAEAAQAQYDTVAFIADVEAANGVLYNRAIALFYANHDINLDQALAFAEQELESRADIYAYDTLAWALYKNGRTAEAVAAIEEAMRLGTQDALLYYHAGMIYNAAGQTEKAIEMLDQALGLNPYFDLLQAQIAQETLNNLQAE